MEKIERDELPAPAPEPQYIACQHEGKWEGYFGPDNWGVVRTADGCWTNFASPLDADYVVRNPQICHGTNWKWYTRKVDDHKHPESQKQETSANNQDKPEYERGWYVNEIGQLRFIVGIAPSGDFVVQTESKLLCEVSESSIDGYKYIPVPECTGWDWKPKPKMRPKTLADCPEGVWVPCNLPSYGYFVARMDDCYSVSTMNHYNGAIKSSDKFKPSQYIVHPPEEVPDSQ